MYPVKLSQNIHEDILRNKLASQHGVHVELGRSLLSLSQLPDRVIARIASTTDSDDIEVTEECAFAYVIGADGAKGVVRKMIGQTLKGESHATALLFGDIRVEEGLGYDVRITLFIYTTLRANFPALM